MCVLFIIILFAGNIDVFFMLIMNEFWFFNRPVTQPDFDFQLAQFSSFYVDVLSENENPEFNP